MIKLENNNDSEIRRFRGDLVAAALIRRPDGQIFLVSRKNEWTIPTGHLDPRKEQELDSALFREMGEEIFEEGVGGEVIISRILGIVTRPAQEDREAKIITIYLCDVTESNAEIMAYSEKNEKGFCWAFPTNELAEAGAIEGVPLDKLAMEALDCYLKIYPEKAPNKIVKVGKWFTEKLKIIFSKSGVLTF